MIMSKAPPKLSNTLGMLVTQNNLSLTKQGTKRVHTTFWQITAQIKRLLVTECWIQMYDLQWRTKFLGQLTRSALIFPHFPLSPPPRPPPKQCCSLCTPVHFTLS